MCEFCRCSRVTSVAPHYHDGNIGKVVIGPSEELLDLISAEPMVEKDQVWTDPLDDIQSVQRIIGHKDFLAILLSQQLNVGVIAYCNDSS